MSPYCHKGDSAYLQNYNENIFRGRTVRLNHAIQGDMFGMEEFKGTLHRVLICLGVIQGRWQ